MQSLHRPIPAERISDLLDARHGLSDSEVLQRRARYGLNLIVESSSRGWQSVLKETLRDPMLWFLAGTSVMFAFVGEWIEASIMLAALVPFLGMDAYLSRRTSASVEGLTTRLATQATVERSGATQVVNSLEVVPGDLVVVRSGESFPADGVLVAADDMQVDESSLTGESLPVHKAVLPPLQRLDTEPSVDGRHWGMACTRVLTGQGLLRVVYTGEDTLYGEIVRSAKMEASARTPLQESVASLVSVLVIAASVACVAMAWVRWQQGHGLLDALLSAVTLAIAALPEEFPIVFTFFMGVGVYRLAKKQALVRRAVVVENIGRVNCICSDKTGTITEGGLRLAHRYAAEGVSESRLVMVGAAASRRETGDPMDIAILDGVSEPLAWSEVARFPYTEGRKRETGIVQENSQLLAAVKGAPEVVIAQCNLPPEDAAGWMARVDSLAREGHKVIACAWRTLDALQWPGGEPDRHFRLAGLLCFEDPVRPGVAEALRACRTAGIRVVMVTGDHPSTAFAIAREIGLNEGDPRVIEGDALGAYLARNETAGIDVVARAAPGVKLELVRALQAEGNIVAVTGDGVNDVPALLAADVGIAMGERGTRSAREVASIVLLNDNFGTIVRAIAEGHQLFANLQMSFAYLLMIHLPLVATAALIPFAGFPLLYLPVHVVWLELIIHPTALLVFQEMPPDATPISAPRDRRARFFSREQWIAILGVGILVTVVVAATYVRSLGAEFDMEHARAMAIVALTAASAGITAGLSGLRGPMSRILVLTTLLLSLLLVQVPSLAALLHLRPLHLEDWMLALAGGLVAAALAAVTRSERIGRLFSRRSMF